jgi:ribulose-5-phosphate 4-epimerase/fuculose-1-phosphate aldolase
MRETEEVRVDNFERHGRVDLAAALRWAARLGLHEGVCNHFSLAVSDDNRRFLVNPRGLHFREVRASDMLLVDVDGALLAGDAPPEPTAFFIHGRLHAANPLARCVLHTHMTYATALTSIEGGRLEPVSQNALRFYGRVAYDDAYNGLALDESEGDRIAEALGDASILFLANHGVIVTGETVAEAFDGLYYLERACETQVLAMATGRPLKRVPEAVAARTFTQLESDREQALLHFESLKRMLEREEADYAR